MADVSESRANVATGVVSGGGGFQSIGSASNRKWLLMMAVLLVVVGLISLSYWSVEPEYRVLYSGVSDQDASSIAQGLEKSAIPYRMETGGTILVPAGRLYDARLQIAGDNLAPTGGTGFELFDNAQSFALSEFSQNVNYQRALQGELSRTIEVLPQVNKARVHLVFAKESAFVKQSQHATASVMLRLKGSGKLSDTSVRAIQNLVASSVPKLEAKHVTVVDSSGNLLSADQNEKAQSQNGQSFTDRQHELQQRMEREVRTMLEQTVGIGQAVVRVNVDLNREYFEMKKRSYNPESVLRSEKVISEKRSNAESAGGVPGEQAALGVGGANVSGSGGEQAARDERTANFEIGETDEHRVMPGGDIKRLSVAVMVGGTMGEDGKFQPRSADELKALQQIVLRAVGYNEDRGDLVEIQSVPLMAMDQSPDNAELTAAEDRAFMIQLAKYGLLGLALLLFALFVLKPLISRLSTPMAVSSRSGTSAAISEMEIDEAKSAIKSAISAKQVVASSAAQRGAMEVVNQIATEDPEKTATIMRKWLEESNDGSKA